MPEQSPRVGYKNPPAHTRFQKGKSGNPAGRPKGKHNSFFDSLRDVLSEKISLTENGVAKKISKQEYLARSLVAHASKSPGHCMRLLMLIEKKGLDKPAPIYPDDISGMSLEEATRIYDRLLKE